MTVEDIAIIPDPVERARVATEQLALHQADVTALARIRREAIQELRQRGLSLAEVGDALGLTRGRIAQLQSRNVIEQDFFGGSVITIAMPLRAGVRPFVAQEDFQAASQLARYLNSVEIETSYAQIAPTGEIDLDPLGLVVICGPKSSPVAAELYDSDPVIGFGTDETGRWFLFDRASGERYLSLSDEDTPGNRDVAYLGRLERPGGKRQVLMIAGIHAVGSLGAVHYLSKRGTVHQLQRDVGSAGFSMVVEAEFTKDPLTIVSSEARVPVRIHRR